MKARAGTRTSATLVVLMCGVTAFGTMQSLVVPVLTAFQAALHTSQSGVTWILTVYLLSAAIFTPIVGRTGDILGRKRSFVVTLLVVGLGCVVCALAPNLAVMLVGRALQGIGGGLMPLSFGIIRDALPPKRVPGAVGQLSSMMALGGGLGIVIGGPAVQALDTRWLFWIPGLMCAAAALPAHFVIPESTRRSPGRISVLPALLLSGWLVCALLALSEAPKWGWLSQRVGALFLGAVVLAVAWVAAEQRARVPLIDLRLLRMPALWTTNVVALLSGMGLYGVWAFVPEFVQTPTSSGYGLGLSITASGLVLLPNSAMTFLAGQNCGRLTRALGAKTVIVAGCAVTALSMALLAGTLGHQWALYVATGLIGAGMGAAFAATSSLIVDAVRRDQTGVASGMNANIRTIGGSIGTALVASIVAASAPRGQLPLVTGYHNAFWTLTGALGLAVLVALAVPALPHRSGAGDEPDHPALALVAAGTVVGADPE